jgi:hypothetical protein
MMKPRVAATLFLLLAVAAGCSGRYGSIRWDTSVARSCDTAQVLPGHRYYTAGSDTAPDAIIALREDRPLRGDLWREVAMTPEILARLVDRMRNNRVESLYGSAILDDRGARIGDWCSFFKTTSVKLLDDGGVFIQLPVGNISDRSINAPSGGR